MITDMLVGWGSGGLRRAVVRFCDGRSTGSPAATAEERIEAPYSDTAVASSATDGLGASTSTRSPCSSAVLAVAGPMQAMTVEACGLPAIPTRLRTVDDEVKTTAS